MGKIVTRVTNPSTHILRDRAIIIEQTLAAEQKKLVNSYDSKIQATKFAISKLTDIAPDQTTSLRVAADIDAPKWVNELQTLSLKLRDLLIAREVAKNNFNEFFGDSETLAEEAGVAVPGADDNTELTEE